MELTYKLMLNVTDGAELCAFARSTIKVYALYIECSAI